MPSFPRSYVRGLLLASLRDSASVLVNAACVVLGKSQALCICGIPPQRPVRARMGHPSVGSRLGKQLLGLHEGYVDLGADGDFFAVDGEGFVAPLSDRSHRRIGEVWVAAYGGDLLDATVGADQGFEDD